MAQVVSNTTHLQFICENATCIAQGMIPAIWELQSQGTPLLPFIKNKAKHFSCDLHKQDLLDRIPATTQTGQISSPQSQPQTQSMGYAVTLGENKFLSGPFRGLLFKITFVDKGFLDIEFSYKKHKETISNELFEAWRKPVTP